MSSGKHDIGKKGRPKKQRSKSPLPGPWRNSSWVNSFGGKGASPLKYQEVSPSFVLRQLLVLIEKGKFIDSSQLLNKINIEALKDIVLDIPIEAIIESIPRSLVVLESLYSRLFVSDADNFPVEQFQVEVMVFHIVRYLSMLQSSMEYKYPKPEDAKKSILNILRIVLNVNPDLVRTLFKRKKLMDMALQGIGEHSLIEMNGSLISLHDALKLEIGRNVTAYKGAVNTLEHLSLSRSKPFSLKINGDKKSGQGLNHQGLTKLNENQIKSRLFKNKALLNAIESRINSQLPALITTLKDRIEYDKNALLAFGKLKSEIKTFSSHTKVVPLLAQYSRSLQSVLNMFKELLDEHCGSDKSSYSTLGYHSDEEDMLSVQGAVEDDVSQEAIAQPETEENSLKKVPSADLIEQIIGPYVNENVHDKLSLPGDETPEKRSRWWKHHRRSSSLDVGGSRGRRRHSISSEPDTPRPHGSSSVDRSTISRPRRESVEESQEFQKMMARIRDMSASSPAIGRRQLVRRGISQPRSRDSSISPAALRRHFFGGGEQTPSISSPTDNVKDDDPDPLYATLKPKGQRATSSSGSDASKDGPSKAKTLEEVSRERDRLAEREKKLMQENERLRETLNLVTVEMEKLREGRKESIEDEVFLLSPVMDEPTAIAKQTSESNEEPPSEDQKVLLQSAVDEPTASSKDSIGAPEEISAMPQEPIPAPEQFSTSTPDLSPSPVSPPSPPSPPSPMSARNSSPAPTSPPVPTSLSDSVSPPEQKSPSVTTSPADQVSPPEQKSPTDKVSASAPAQQNSLSQSKKTASFVEQQKAILRDQAEQSGQSSFKTCHQPLEELPETTSVKQRKASFERQLEASQVKQPAKVDQKPDLQSLDPPQQQASTDQQPEENEQLKSSSEAQVVELPAEKPLSPDPSKTAPKPPITDDQPKETAAQEKSTTDPQPSTPSSQNQTSPSEKSLPDIKPKRPAPKPKPPSKQAPSKDTQESGRHSPPAPRKAKSATFSSQLHLAAIPESSSPAIQPKSASLVKQSQLPESPQRILTASKNRLTKNSVTKLTHTTRHLPKNLLRHVTGDLLYDYDKLYSEQRAVAWTCVIIPQEDKDTLLFWVIVFAFQSAQTTIHELHMAKARMLQIPVTDEEESVSSYTMDIPPDNRSQVELLEHLRKMGDTFDLKPMIEDVLEQLCEISEHQHILQTSTPLRKFVTNCVSLAWRLSTQSAPYVIDFELRSFDPAVHQRAPGSNRKSPRVVEHIWPALLESTKGMCVYKGVVLT